MSCEICRGSRVIRLTRHRPLSVADLELPPPQFMNDHRATFPCPECTGGVAEERVFIAHTQSDVRTEELAIPEARDAIERGHAAELGCFARSRGLMKTREVSRNEQMTAVRSTIGFVSPQRVASIEERVLEAATKIVTEAFEEGLREMWNWGSYYGREGISKEIADRMIREGVKRVLDAHRERINEQRSDGDARAEGGAPAEGGRARRGPG